MRLKPKHRKQLILSAAVKLADIRGIQYVTQREIAHTLGMSPSLIYRYFPSMHILRDAVMTEAVRTSKVPVVAQGLGAQNPIAMAAPDDLKEAAARWMLEGDK